MNKFLKITLISLLTITIFESCGEKDCSASYTEGFQKGKNEGFTEGKSEGRSEGFNQGKSEGFQQGSNGGYTKGYDEGVQKGKELSKTEYETKVASLQDKQQEELTRIKTQGEGGLLISPELLTILRGVLHLITLAGIFAMGFFIVGQIKGSDDWLIKSLFVVAAFFIVFLLLGVKYSPLDSIAKLFGIAHLTQNRFWRIAITGSMGFIVSMLIHLVSFLNFAVLERYMVLFSTLIIMFFILIYIEGWSQPENLYLNAAFLLGIVIYVGTFVWKNIGGKNPTNIFKSFYEQFQ